jgi:hypothetical protein
MKSSLRWIRLQTRNVKQSQNVSRTWTKVWRCSNFCPDSQLSGVTLAVRGSKKRHSGLEQSQIWVSYCPRLVLENQLDSISRRLSYAFSAISESESTVHRGKKIKVISDLRTSSSLYSRTPAIWAKIRAPSYFRSSSLYIFVIVNISFLQPIPFMTALHLFM